MKHTFVKKLDEALRAAGVRPFLDASDLEHGKKTWDSILEAIRVAPVFICVFSPGYAESSWCLDELAEIYRSSGKQILPVFYNVKPFHLRRPENGPFAEGLSKQKDRHKEKVLEWMDCLSRSADLYGYELEKFSGYIFTSPECIEFCYSVLIMFHFCSIILLLGCAFVTLKGLL